MTIMDMSGIYQNESFYRMAGCGNYLNLEDLKETDCYCAEKTENRLRAILKDQKPGGIHFLDSGNYHYLSLLWMEKIKKDFELVLIDHHPDMQQPSLLPMLSCGGWVRTAMEQLPHLRKVTLRGVGKKLVTPEMEELLEQRQNRPVKQEQGSEMGKDGGKENLPVYLSLDKDVLSEKVIETNWDQGTMTMPQLEGLLRNYLSTRKIISLDICGEISNEPELPGYQEELEKNDACNCHLLKFIKNLYKFN